MTYFCTHQDNVWTVWIGTRTHRVYEASDPSLELAMGKLAYALSQRDDPNARPYVHLVEVK